MAKDVSALTIQGPDNLSGNPLAVTNATPANNQIDLEQIRGNLALTAIAGLLKVAITDTLGNTVTAETIGVPNASLRVSPPAGTPQTGSAVNAAVVITLPAVAGARNKVLSVSLHFSGANVAGTLTVVDAVVSTILAFAYAAATNTTVQVILPIGGIQGSTNSAVTITLPAGGAGVTGFLNMSSYAS